jgi:hypothetical protein
MVRVPDVLIFLSVPVSSSPWAGPAANMTAMTNATTIDTSDLVFTVSSLELVMFCNYTRFTVVGLQIPSSASWFGQYKHITR